MTETCNSFSRTRHPIRQKTIHNSLPQAQTSQQKYSVQMKSNTVQQAKLNYQFITFTCANSDCVNVHFAIRPQATGDYSCVRRTVEANFAERGRGRAGGRPSPEIWATVVDYVVNHGLTLRQRVLPNLSRFAVASIIQTFHNENKYVLQTLDLQCNGRNSPNTGVPSLPRHTQEDSRL